MSRDDILGGIQTVVDRHLDLERSVTIEPATDILGDLQLDSIQQFTLIVELENHFRIAFSSGDEQGIATIADVVELIDAQMIAARR